MSDRALYLLAHVASQLVYRWLPPPVAPEEALPFGARWPTATCVEPEFRRALGAAAQASLPLPDPDPWQPLIAAELVASAPRLPWLRVFSERYDPEGGRLARAITRQLALAEAAGATLITPADDLYPTRLRLLADPPHALMVLGEPALLAGRCVSVVGSRKASGHALQESFALGRALAATGYVVVSGGAFGCDIAAHHGVLAAAVDPPAPAVCVFAGGLADLYPRANLPVFRRLAARRAALVSERLWESPCRPADFAARNRLIAGLAPVTAVMQAAVRSGAMVTARLALDAGRQVAVLRHPAGDVRADGSALLVEAGAPGFAHARELMERLTLSPASPPS